MVPGLLMYLLLLSIWEIQTNFRKRRHLFGTCALLPVEGTTINVSGWHIPTFLYVCVSRQERRHLPHKPGAHPDPPLPLQGAPVRAPANSDVPRGALRFYPFTRRRVAN